MRPRRLTTLLICGLVLAASALSCNLPTMATPSPAPGLDTQVALTVDARLTETGAPPETPGASEGPTARPTWTLKPSATRPQDTRVPPSATPRPCNEASFIQDVTIADGTKMTPGQAFTKTWRLQNVGTCTWTSGYAVVFVSGEAMGAPAVVNLQGDVPPNSTVDFSIGMKAPASPGKYTGFWKMRAADGEQFGVSGIDQPFFVQIEVIALTATPSPTTTSTAAPTSSSAGLVYDLAEHYCDAEWRSRSGVLDCPGIEGDAWGYALRRANARVETGAEAGTPALLTYPDSSANGAITGKYPPLQIQKGQRFQASLGCAYGASGCSVVFQLNYIIGDSPAASLGQWTHNYSGALENVDVDLSPLAGKQAQIILAVLSGGSSEGDQALWVNPRIIQP